MPTRLRRPRALAAVLLAAAFAAPAAVRADEGMWLLNAPPRQLLEEKYGFNPSAEWLQHVQKSAVRFSTGGSGSIISSRGLVMTNHHVVSELLAKMSTPQRRLLDDGFLARTAAEEIKVPDLELLCLWSIEDVTAKVNIVVEPGMSASDAGAARRRRMSELEKQSQDQTGLYSQIVTLYQGGRYHLYRYKRFTDVRLVFAPQKEIAFFGGDADNFEYPRYCLDMALLRIYDKGKPLRAEHFLAWSAEGTAEGDLAIVIGHPGTTRRLYTLDHLAFLRDVENPLQLRNLWRAEVKAQNFAARSEEYRRAVEDDLMGIANGRKFLTGQLATLHDPRTFAAKAEEEKALRAAVAADPEKAEQWGGAWDRISKAMADRREWHVRSVALGGTFMSELYTHARAIVRLSEELPKPSEQRLREYRDSNLESVYLDLYSPTAYHAELEAAKLGWALANMAELLGGDDPIVAAVLAGKSPAERGRELVAGTTLFDVAARRKLVQGGREAVMASQDPLIKLALTLDPEARALRAKMENEVEAVTTEAYAAIAAARFDAYGESVYPDATFTLRMSFGPVRGYDEGNTYVPPFTNFNGLYERFEERRGQEGFTLPKVWLDSRGRLDLETPFNFVCTADIIGGNSGSPVINTKGEVIGLVFDGNIHALGAAVRYDDTLARCVAVDSRGIIEALTKVYNAKDLVDEILAR